MRDQVILGLAGRKQSGKGTSYTCIRLWRPEAVEFSFAEPLKRMAVDILGLSEWQVFGTDEEKRTLVPHLLWDNFPLPAWERPDKSVFIGHPDGMRFPYYEPPSYSFATPPIPYTPPISYTGVPAVTVATFETKRWNFDETWNYGMHLTRKRGPMTAREVLQYYGTEIFRKHYHDVWADAAIRKIRKAECPLAIVTDVRFANEVEAIQNAGGRVVKLTRNPYPDDNHPSEVSLDAKVYDQSKFDFILDNTDMTISEQSEALYALMRKWGIIELKSVQRMHA
jgi:hypothetical protein